MVFRFAVGHLRAKEVKAKQVRLRLILKNLKNYQPIKWMSIDTEHAGVGVQTLFVI